MRYACHGLFCRFFFFSLPKLNYVWHRKLLFGARCLHLIPAPTSCHVDMFTLDLILAAIFADIIWKLIFAIFPFISLNSLAYSVALVYYLPSLHFPCFCRFLCWWVVFCIWCVFVLMGGVLSLSMLDTFVYKLLASYCILLFKTLLKNNTCCFDYSDCWLIHFCFDIVDSNCCKNCWHAPQWVGGKCWSMGCWISWDVWRRLP